MCLLVYFLLLPLSLNLCAKPRSVNFALETVFEFGNETDITLVESVQDFLSKIKGALEYSYRRNEQPRRFNSMLVTEFIEDSIKILKSYNDLDLGYFIELLDTELNEHDYKHCEVKILNKISLRKFIAEKLSDARSSPIEQIRRNLDDILDDLRNKRDSSSQIYNFLNSLVKRHSQERFRSTLNNLQLYRRRRMDPPMTLRSVVQDSIRSLINDYICNLNYSHSRKLRKILKSLNENVKVDLPNLKGFNWNRDQKKAMEENDNMYESISDSREDTQKDKNIESNKEEILKKEKFNTSLTNSEDTLDLKIDDSDYRDYKTKPNKHEHFYDTTKNTVKTKAKKKRQPYAKKKTSISTYDYSIRSNSESKEDRSNFFDNTNVPTSKQLKTTKKKRLITFVTLYPEIITYLTRSDKKKKKGTDNVRKKFNKLNKEGSSKELIKGFNIAREDTKSKTEVVIKLHESGFNIGMDKSTKSEHTSKVQNSDRKRFKIKSNLSTLKSQGSISTNKEINISFESEEKSKMISNEASSNKYNEIEHFGSLYKQKYNNKPEIITEKYRGYRKSNNLVTTDTKKIENKNTKAYGTSFLRETKNSTDKETFSKNNSSSKFDAQYIITNVSINNNQNITSLEANDKITVTLRTSLQNEISSIIEKTTEYRNDTTYWFSNSPSTKTTKTLDMLKKADLRRLLDNSILNEINDDSQRKMNQRFQEDLNKIFFISPNQTPKSLKENTDPIDEIEEAFNLR